MSSIALILRNIAGFLIVTVAARFAFVEGKTLALRVSSSEVTSRRAKVGAEDESVDPLERLGQSAIKRRIDLKQLNEENEFERPVAADDADDATKLRRIIVDLGPERSKVFINGMFVGETPYGGQLSCGSKAQIDLVVLPETGAPLRRSLICAGAQLSVVH